jgi:DNA-binding transcriptional MocR family regulator
MYGVNQNIVTMTSWRPRLRSDLPRYLAIADGLAADIANRKLVPGTRMPTHRDLADVLGVTIGTVSRAYAEAARRGLITGEVGRGTFVRSAAGGEPGVSEGGSPDVVDLSVNHPPPVEGAEAAALSAALRSLSRRRDMDALLSYPAEGGSRAHREAAAEWIARGGHSVPADRVVLTSGSQHGLVALLSMLAREGEVILAEELTYPGLKAIAGLLRLRVQPVAMDAGGLVPAALDEACARTGARVLYAMPTIHNPVASILSPRRREEVAEIVARRGLILVEDDVHGRLATSPPPPIAALVPDRAFYVGSTSKTLAPGLRVGFVAAPPAMAERLASTVRVTTWGAAPLTSEIVAEWIRDGTAESLLAARRREAAARHELVRAALGVVPGLTAGAYHCWMPLPAPWRSAAFAAECRRRGVAVTPSDAFHAGAGEPPSAVRLCVGAPRTRDALARGLRAVGQALEAMPEAALAIV